MTVEFDYSYLRGFIIEHFGTVRNFARFLGLGESATYDRLGNRRPFTQTEIDKVANYGHLNSTETSRLFFTRKIRKTV